MNWSNVKFIFFREVRDQLRDRRTLFMIAVLPLLLYPLLGMSFFQIAQFMREHASQVLVLGHESAEGLPELVAENHFDDSIPTSFDQHLVELGFEPGADTPQGDKELADRAVKLLRDGAYEAVVLFPHDFPQRLASFRQQLRRSSAEGNPDAVLDVPEPIIFHNSAKEKSAVAHGRVAEALREWRNRIGQQNLADNQLPQTAVKPFEVAANDVAETSHRDAALWSKILPFVLLIWALTGAFYPAIDLCAGEKERGTLETLLSSPAERSEIVTGKLFTIMSFSLATSILNLLCMGITSSFIVPQLGVAGALSQGIQMPPWSAIVWLLLALLPVSALFSALCLALAAFARSTKEGQYYLMPLVLITMPLMILPLAPGVELTLGNSLIPVTGVVLLLRMLLEGNYGQALPYVFPVVAVTGGCCVLAMRWAIDQFNKESVLFRESERLDVGLWLRHMVNEREDTPSVGQAVFCGVLILVIKFFMSFALPVPRSFADVANMIGVMQLAVIATPALLMAVMLTRSPPRTLLLRWPRLLAIPMAVLLAVAIHPVAMFLRVQVQRLYPMNEDLLRGMTDHFEGVPMVYLILLIAVLPAICEELAFRGFILSGFRHLGHRWRAIVLSSLIFGFTHSVLQQSLLASLFGAVLGYLAVQTGSILPSIFFHVTHNSLGLLAGYLPSQSYADWMIVRHTGGDFEYQWWVVLLGLGYSALLLWYFRSLPSNLSPEEAVQESIENHRPPVGLGRPEPLLRKTP